MGSTGPRSKLRLRMPLLWWEWQQIKMAGHNSQTHTGTQVHTWAHTHQRVAEDSKRRDLRESR